jgi:hypothetical protein
VIIVNTPHFHQSPWCRKELWLARSMAEFGRAQVVELSLEGAIEHVAASTGSTLVDAPLGTEYHYPITQRILKDLNYEMRTPNKISLAKTGKRLSSISSLEKYLVENFETVDSFGERLAPEILGLFEGVVRDTPSADSIDLWSTALQLAIAAFVQGAYGRSKDEVRRGIDQLNGALKELISDKIIDTAVFRERGASYLAFLAAAVASDIAGYRLHPIVQPALIATTAGTSVLRKGLLMLDARQPGPVRDVNLRILMALVSNNVGSVGIVQTASDPVHELSVDGKTLAVLPCVTLYPGMESMFPEFDSPPAGG